jgi:hypothetical protein
VKPEGQATYETADLWPSTTGLPFVVWVFQPEDRRGDAQVKAAPLPTVITSQMSSYAVQPFRHVAGPRLIPEIEKLLGDWVEKNRAVLIAYWGADIEFTEDVINRIVPI